MAKPPLPPPTKYGAPRAVQNKPASRPIAHPPPVPRVRVKFLLPPPIPLNQSAAVQARLSALQPVLKPRLRGPAAPPVKKAWVVQLSSEKSSYSSSSSSESLKQGECGATLSYTSKKGTSGTTTGNYNSSGSGEHAEMEALSDFVDSDVYKSDGLAAIQSIDVTSPCCKICASVLKTLGILGKITSKKDGFGHCNGAYGVPRSETLRKLIYDQIGDMEDPYALVPSKRKLSDYNSSKYWDLLKRSIQG